MNLDMFTSPAWPATVFTISANVAMACWIWLIFLPRYRWALATIQFGVLGVLSLVYVVLVFVFFFRVPGGGYNSIEQVRALFLSDPVLVAGWIHYLAFDLFVGVWIARQADQASVSRWIQGPVLLSTFMFGPLGFLLHVIMMGRRNRP
jgi:Domain of unknown function (DUF4281)